MVAQPENVIFWGAGATAALGIRTTERQAKFIQRVTGADSNDELKDRITEALGSDTDKRWRKALFDLITILGDTEKSYDGIDIINKPQLEAMKRNWWKDAPRNELKSRIIHLRLIYDWPALKSLVKI